MRKQQNPRFWLMLAGMLILAGGCSSSFDKPDSSADFGPVPTNIREQVESHFSAILKDPESAKYTIGKPRKAYVNDGLLQGGNVVFTGYLVPVAINAKNAFGGYTGYKPYLALFRDGVLIRHVGGESHPLIHEVGPPVSADDAVEPAPAPTKATALQGEQRLQAQRFSDQLNCSQDVELLKSQYGREIYSADCANGRLLLFVCQWRQCELME